MFLTFEKWQGCLNDFLVTWVTDSDGEVVTGSLKRQARHLCDRRAGVGADGVLVLHTRQHGDLMPYGLTIINSDGSVAKNCGNGLRCAASSVLKAHRERGDPKSLPEAVELLVEGQTLASRFVKAKGAYPLVAVEMGIPRLGDAVPWVKAAKAAVAQVTAAAGHPELAADAGFCDLGNPHVVLTSDLASRALMLELGPALQRFGPDDGGLNVHLVKPVALTGADQARAGNELGHELAELYRVYVWERGAGETMACGSGACAVAALALASGFVARGAYVGVDMPGGRLYVKQAAPADPVLLVGPAAFVFEGKVSI